MGLFSLLDFSCRCRPRKRALNPARSQPSSLCLHRLVSALALDALHHATQQFHASPSVLFPSARFGGVKFPASKHLVSALRNSSALRKETATPSNKKHNTAAAAAAATAARTHTPYGAFSRTDTDLFQLSCWSLSARLASHQNRHSPATHNMHPVFSSPSQLPLSSPMSAQPGTAAATD